MHGKGGRDTVTHERRSVLRFVYVSTSRSVGSIRDNRAFTHKTCHSGFALLIFRLNCILSLLRHFLFQNQCISIRPLLATTLPPPSLRTWLQQVCPVMWQYFLARSNWCAVIYIQPCENCLASYSCENTFSFAVLEFWSVAWETNNPVNDQYHSKAISWIRCEVFLWQATLFRIRIG